MHYLINPNTLTNILQLIRKPMLLISKNSIVDINETLEKELGIKKEELVGQELSKICSPKLIKTIGKDTIQKVRIQFNNTRCDCYAIVIEEENQRQELDLISDENINKLDYFEAIIAEIPVSVYWMNKDFIYLGCSKSMAKLLNLPSRQDIVGKTYTDLYDKKSAAVYIKADKTVIEKGISLSVEEPLYQSNGKKFIYLSKKVPLHDHDGKIIGMLGISTDITERKKMEQDLVAAKVAAESADRAKTEFIANMGHDIRTPLSGVIGMAGILESTLSHHEHKTEAHMIQDSGEELLSMLNDILDGIREGSLNKEITNTPFDLYRCIDDLIKLERPTATIKDLGLYMEIDPSVPQVIVSDRKKIQRILLNLLGNALKFTESGHVAIRVKCVQEINDERILQFCVEDTGIGIPKELHSRVFEKFYRSSPSYKGIYKGHGLGLHIAKTYAELLDSQITLESEQRVGSKFQFEILCRKGNAYEIATQISNTISPAFVQPTSSSDSPYCLLVEDNITALAVLESLFSKAGCRFISAKNSEEALKLIKSTTFDLIITDVGLPGISGTELSSVIREWEKSNHKKPQPIIGLTGHAREIAYQDCIASGMNDVFTKPANLELVHNIIGKYTHHPYALKKNIENPAIKLGLSELPQTESEFFDLEQYPLLDIEEGIRNCGNNEKLFLDVLTLMVAKELPNDLEQMKLAFSHQDFPSVEKIAHRIKGGGVYLGMVRMKMACQYLERYWKTGERQLFEKLYLQAVTIIQASCQYVSKWLTK